MNIIIKYQILSIIYPVSNIEHTISSMRCHLLYSKYWIPSIRYQVFNIKKPLSGILYQVLKIEYKILSIRYQVFDIKYPILSIKWFHWGTKEKKKSCLEYFNWFHSIRSHRCLNEKPFFPVRSGFPAILGFWGNFWGLREKSSDF